MSYAREDEHRANEVHDVLVDAGHTPWQDTRELLGGEDWDQATREAIARSDFFVALLSHHSIRKRGYFQCEVSLAVERLAEHWEKDIFLIPLRLDDCQVPDRLVHLQDRRVS